MGLTLSKTQRFVFVSNLSRLIFVFDISVFGCIFLMVFLVMLSVCPTADCEEDH